MGVEIPARESVKFCGLSGQSGPLKSIGRQDVRCDAAFRRNSFTTCYVTFRRTGVDNKTPIKLKNKTDDRLTLACDV